MILAIPILLLILSTFAILILQWVKPNFGISWLISAGVSLIVWVLILIFHWIPASQLDIFSWRPVEGILTPLSFKVDLVSWPYALSLASVLLSATLTAPIRFSYETSPRIWAGFLIITGVGLLAIFSANALTLILAWIIIDLTEFILLYRSINGSNQIRSSVITFSMKILGTFFVLWSMAINRTQGQVLTFTNIVPEVGIYILIGTSLRLGVLPLHLPYSQDVQFRRGLGTVLRLVSAASSLVILGRLPPAVVPPNWAILLLIFTSLATLYGSIMWMISGDELEGRPYWLISLAGLAIACSIRGVPATSITWGCMLVLAGAAIFFYSNHEKRFLFFAFLSFLSMTGLPFTPASFGWFGLVVLPFSSLDLLIIFAYTILLIGLLRHILRSGTLTKSSERWAEFLYPVGMLFLIISQWIIDIFGWSGSITSGVWWASIVTSILSIFGVITYKKYGQIFKKFSEKNRWIQAIFSPLLKWVADFARFDWFYTSLDFVYKFIQKIILTITILLEGEGGFLWALVLLVLVFSAFSTSGNP